MLHTDSDSYGLNKKKRKMRLSHSSTEQWMGRGDADPLFTTSLLSAAAATGEESPAHVSSFTSRSFLPNNTGVDDDMEKKKLLKKNRHSSISLTSFSEWGFREEPEIRVSEVVAGAVIHPRKVPSMSRSRMEVFVNRLLFARSGNESLSPQDVQQEAAIHIENQKPILMPRPRRLLHFLESSVPLHGRRRSLTSSEGNEEHGDVSMIRRKEPGKSRTGGKFYSSPSLSSSGHKQLSYSFDDIDRLIQMTPERKKNPKNKKSSRQADHAEHEEQEDGEEMDRLLVHHHEYDSPYAESDASADKPLNQDYSAISMRSRRSEQHNSMKKCNSNFEMGSFAESASAAANRKRLSRLSGLFHEKGFAAFREEDEQSGSFSGQSLLPHAGRRGESVSVMRMQRAEAPAEYEDQGDGDQALRDKSSLFSARQDSHTICSKSLPGSEQRLSVHDADDVPQLNVTPDERSSATSGDPRSMTCNSMRFCRLCLEELPESEFVRIVSCGCSFCRPCLSLYLTIRIQENLNISSLSCPDACCPAAEAAINSLITGNNHPINRKKNLKFRLMRGLSLLRRSKSFILNDESKSSKSHEPGGGRVPNLITKNEIEQLVDVKTLHLYNKLMLEAEVESDPCKTFCPAADCDNICLIVRQSSAVMSVSSTISSLSSVSPAAATTVLMSANKLQRSSTRTIPNPAIYCCKCDKRFCLSCRHDYHPGLPCDSSPSNDSQQLLHLSSSSSGEDVSSDIKRCPRCSVLIERDAGCAQMMCRKCRHVFCWFCLQSLEDDFLLRHYDRGPCKNKLGHSRASVVWHRTQVVGIFAGFGVLLLLISPLFLMAAPCLLCCNCFTCSSCQQPAELLTPSSSFSSTSERKDKQLLHFDH